MINDPAQLSKYQDFIKVCSQYKLGELPTEQSHPATGNLSNLAKNDLIMALQLLHQIDAFALTSINGALTQIQLMAEKIDETLQSGNSVFLCGCGATGRLSLACESIFRRVNRDSDLENRVIGFMAGGDLALIRSIENFEDHPEYGARQLEELGFKNGDLLISSTEGGETPFVIGATEKAAKISSNRPYFLYCNPDDILCKVAQRSQDVITNPDIIKINLSTGPMALAGSTRMQASTALMFAVGSALLYHDSPEMIVSELATLMSFWNNLDSSFLEPFVQKEADSYDKGDFLLYQSEPQLAISLLTDTTERSPTFSMLPFENVNEATSLSLCYLYMPDAQNSTAAWNLLLGRKPRALHWECIGDVASEKRLLGFDFSLNAHNRRKTAAPLSNHKVFSVDLKENLINFKFDDCSHSLFVKELSFLSVHLVLKMLLNAHSTLVMGRLGRYEGNIMTWVRPSNNKLIDRAIRYVAFLLQRDSINLEYEEIAKACFEHMSTVKTDQPLVLAVYQHIIDNYKKI